MRFASRDITKPLIKVTPNPDAGTVTVWVDDEEDSVPWACLTLTRSDMDGLAREFGVEIDDSAADPDATVTAPTSPDVGYAVESADDDGPDIILGHDLGENGGA